MLKEPSQFENREVQTDRPGSNLAEVKVLSSQQTQECSLLGSRPKDFLIKRSMKNLFDQGSLTTRSYKSPAFPLSKARNNQAKGRREPANFQRKIDCERKQSDRNLSKFRVHLETVSCFSDRLKEKYFGIVSSLDQIRLKNMEQQMKAERNNLTHGMKNQFVELFDSEARVKSIDDMVKLRVRALKVHDLVHNQKLWIHK